MDKLKKRRSVRINNTEFRHYIEDYWIDDTGNLSKIKFNEENEVCFFKTMKQHTCHYGHKRVEIKVNKNQKKMFIHRIVYEVWVGELIDGMVIEHLDANPANNHVSNLKQSTQRENIYTSIRQNRFNKLGHNRKPIVVYDNITKLSKEYTSFKEFLIDINAPEYMVKHGGMSTLNKRKEYRERYVIEEIEKKR